MLKKYLVNKNSQLTGVHKIHKEDCTRIGRMCNCIELGEFHTDYAAKCEAKKYYANCGYCSYCCRQNGPERF